MTLEQGLYAHLTAGTAPVGSALAEVYEAIGGLSGQMRVSYVQLPQGQAVWPALTIQRIGDGRRVWSHGGPSGLVETRLQLDAWARDTDAMSGDGLVALLTEALRRSLDGFVGQWGSVTIRKVMLDSERDDYDPDIEAQLWRRSQDYLVWHEETT